MVDGNWPLYERPTAKRSETESKIGKLIAENLVDNGATLQMGMEVVVFQKNRAFLRKPEIQKLRVFEGIGAIPDAALASLKNHKDLGIHTEMFSDGVLELVSCGAITNALKKIHAGKIVSSFVYGSKRVYDFLHDNPMISTFPVPSFSVSMFQIGAL